MWSLMTLDVRDERRRNLLLDSRDTVLWLTPDGVYTDVHSPPDGAAPAVSSEIIGRSITDVFASEETSHILAALQRVAATQTPETVTYGAERPEGRRFFEARLLPSGGEIAAIVRDVTEPTSAQQRNLAQSQYLSSLLADTFDILVVADERGIIQFANKAVTTILGYDLDSVIGTELISYIRPSERPEATERFVANLHSTGSLAPIERELMHHDGSTRTCEVIVTNLLNDPHVGGVAFHARDVSGRLMSQRFFRQMFETHPIATGLMPFSGQGVQANPAYAQMMGRSVEELRSMHAINLIAPEARPLANADAPRLMRTDEVATREYTFLRADGSTFIGSVTMRAMDAPTGERSLLVAIEDITQWRAAETERDRASSRLQVTLDNSSDIIVLIEPDGEWSTNRHGVNELGYPVGFDEANLLNFAHPDDRPKVAEVIAATFAGTRDPNEYLEIQVLAADGSTRLYWTKATFVPELNAIVATLRDISEQRKAQATLHQRELELAEANAARERAELEARLRQAQRLESTGRLAAGVAHDFTNLLGVTLNYLSVLERGNLDDAQRADVALIRETSMHAAELAQRLMRLGRSEDANFIEPVDLADTITQVSDLMLPSFVGGRTLEFHHAGTAVISADRGQIEQLVLNLILNGLDAIKPDGCVTLSAGLDEHDPAYVTLTVADDGAGMPPHVLERALDPFFTTKQHGTGTGLGLSIVAGVVASTQGEISLRSAPNEGTSIQIRWPRLVPYDIT